MKLSETTIDILKNFSAINPNMVFKEGNTVATIAEAKNIMASATIEERITREFGIYDLNEFLSTISLISDPTLDLGKDSITVRDDSSSIEYFYSSPEVLTAPTKNVSMPKAEVKVTLTADQINKIKKAASVLGHPTLQFSGKNGVVTAQIIDLKNKTANKYSVVIDEKNACKEVFSFVIVIGNLKMLPGDYTVSMSSKLISHFKNNSIPVEYWIALEKDSTFGS
jgi:hypothetical protein